MSKWGQKEGQNGGQDEKEFSIDICNFATINTLSHEIFSQ